MVDDVVTANPGEDLHEQLHEDLYEQEDPWTLNMDPVERDAYERWVQRAQDLRRSRDRRRCYECRPVTGRVRRVVSTFVTSKHFDPTTAYRLVCGHATIDIDC